MLDIEVDEGLSPTQLQAWTRDFLSETERLTGRVPMGYTYRYFWGEHMADSTAFARYPLWLAAYQNTVPESVGGWDSLTFWQRSDADRVAGIDGPVDLNLSSGTDSQLGDFVAGRVGQLLDAGELPVDDLLVMVENPDYPIGGLLILLNNAG